MSYPDCELRTNPNGPGECWFCPSVPPVEGRNAYYESHIAQGWNAGARSILELDSHCFTRFTVYPAVGVVVGFAKRGEFNQEDPATIEHGLYIYTSEGATWAQPYEYGAAFGRKLLATPATEFEIRREHGRVTMKRDGRVEYASRRRSTGPVVVGACLYQTRDCVL